MSKLSNEQYILLSNIFHKQYDEQSETETGDIPTESFTAVVGMVEEYMALREQPDVGEAREPIENALYATSRFTTTEATDVAEGVLNYLKDAGYMIVAIATLRESAAQPAIEWKPGPPDISGNFVMICKEGDRVPFVGHYNAFADYWDEVLFHIVPIPKTPKCFDCGSFDVIVEIEPDCFQCEDCAKEENRRNV